MAVPSLRFKEFKGDWLTTQLGKQSVFHDSKRVPISEDERRGMQGIYPYYGASGIIDYVNDYIFDGEYVLLGEDGANIVTRSTRLAFLVKGKNWVNNHAHVLEAKGDPYFLAESLERIRYEKYNTGTAQPKLNSEVCRKIKLVFPPTLPEQRKIADFLSTVDEKIRLLTAKKEKLETYKKGVMQKLFPKAGQTNPELRFKRPDGSAFPDWEERRLGEVVNITMGQSPDSKSYNDQAIGLPLIQGNADIKGRNSAPRQFTNEPTKECRVGDLILTVRAPVGYISKSSHHACLGRGVCSISNKPTTVLEFIYQFLLDYERKWVRLEQGSTFTAVSGSDIKSIKLRVPFIEEQRIIASFLGSVDKRIEMSQSEIDQMKDFKKGLLQQMFV